MVGFHRMRLSGTSSATLSEISLQSPSVISFIGCAAELYTAGCEVSLKEGEKKTLR
jgi:hypothetical protein